MVESGLAGELRIVWDMFTMLFHAFIHLAVKRLSVPPTRATQHDISQAIMSHTDENIRGRVPVCQCRWAGTPQR